MSDVLPVTRDACVARDQSEPLRLFRDRFVLPDGVIYLDGNSLGPLPRAAPDIFNRTIEREWGHDLIGSWNSAGWFDMPVRLGDRIGKLLGADAGQTVVCDTTSINLFKALHAAMALQPDRDVIVAESGSFPTDLYIIEGAMNSAGRPMQRRLIGADGASLDALLDQRVAVVVLSHVDYRSGAIHDMEAVTRKIHECRRAGDLGRLPFGRRDRTGVRRSRGRFHGRLHLQISQRRSGIAGFHRGRQGASGRCAAPAVGLVGARRAVRVRA